MASLYIHIIFIFILIFLFVLPFSLAQSNGNIEIGASLTAGDTNKTSWLSASGDFAFGFKQIQQNEFLLSIWYDKIQQKTVVWYSIFRINGTDNPVVPNGSTIRLDAQGGLILTDPRGQKLWSTDVNDVAGGVLNDTGNLVLVSNTSINLWQSFQHFTDTLLPSQQLDLGQMLISRRSEMNFSQGKFYVEMQPIGNLIAITKSYSSNQDYDAMYYNSLTYQGEPNLNNSGNPGVGAVFNGSAIFYVLRKNNERKPVAVKPVPDVGNISDYYHRVTLDFDGVLTQYYYNKSSSGDANWIVVWTIPDDDICLRINETSTKGSSGLCGFNSVCSVNKEKRPVCRCPNGYSLVDPNDEYGDCQPNLPLNCDRSDNFDFHILNDTEWRISDNYEQLNSSSEEACKDACLQDCVCAVAMFRGDRCWKNKLPLSNGLNFSLGSKAFLKYRKQDAPSEPKVGEPEGDASGKGNNDHRISKTLLSALIGSSVFISLLLIGTILLGFYKINQKKIIKNSGRNISDDVSLRCFTFQELHEATDGFKEELGRGAFGIVYKGVLSSGSTIAVKKLDSVVNDTEKEFRTEVNVIGQTHHKNLVRLIGYCDEGQNRLLVYEYMSNGTLASFISGEHKPSWSQRIKIAHGIARGLSYLHEECSTHIIHCDIKPQNILLDECYNAKISDFGLAKHLMLNQSRTSTGIRGTRGYVAPEWFRNTQISTKVDVFSFGVVLLEIITCRKSLDNIEVGGEDKFVFLTDWAWECYEDGRLDELVGRDMEALEEQHKLERYVMIGLWCIQENASNRPTMRTVTQMLEGSVEVTSPPCPYPSFSTHA